MIGILSITLKRDPAELGWADQDEKELDLVDQMDQILLQEQDRQGKLDE